MNDLEYRNACLEKDLNDLKEAVKKYMAANKVLRDNPGDKSSRVMAPIWKAEAEVKNIIYPQVVKSVSQKMFEGQ